MLHYRLFAANALLSVPAIDISIIIPVLNEASIIEETLRCLQPMRSSSCELLVVDGGSTDNTPELAEPLADRVVFADRGRAMQMNAGARISSGRVLWFLHADTCVSAAALKSVLDAVEAGRRWGRLDVRLSGRQPLLRLVEAGMNLRSRLTGIATGDQGIFVHRETFMAIGGFPDLPLMEDVEISRRLGRVGRPACLRVRVTTSSRRWETQGILATIALMWRLRFAHWCGQPVDKLAKIYDES